MSYKVFSHILGCDSPEKNGSDEFKETIRYNQVEFFVPWSSHKFPPIVSSNKLE